MTHLRTLINEQQDGLVSAPVRLMRLLVRENDSEVRKQMLRQKLLDVQVRNHRIPLSFFPSYPVLVSFNHIISSSCYVLTFFLVHVQGTLTVDQQRADTAALMAKGELVLDTPPSPSPAVDSSSEVMMSLLPILFFRVNILISFLADVVLSVPYSLPPTLMTPLSLILPTSALNLSLS